MKKGPDAYDLCIDDGRQAVQLTSQQDRWQRIEAGTTVVMRIIHYQSEPILYVDKYKCPKPGCNTWNKGTGGSSIDW